MPNIYIISGCNGAGKTTASFTVLPEMLDCDVFINADEIAKGLSPLNPSKSAIEAGRLMLQKINHLISRDQDFAFETTLATKSYASKIKKARDAGYQITLVFFYLESQDLAIERVKSRVSEGGHDIPENVIRRRYNAGIKNLFDIYIPLSHYWMIFDNSNVPTNFIAEGYSSEEIDVLNNRIFEEIKRKYK